MATVGTAENLRLKFARMSIPNSCGDQQRLSKVAGHVNSAMRVLALLSELRMRGSAWVKAGAGQRANGSSGNARSSMRIRKSGRLRSGSKSVSVSTLGLR